MVTSDKILWTSVEIDCMDAALGKEILDTLT